MFLEGLLKQYYKFRLILSGNNFMVSFVIDVRIAKVVIPETLCIAPCLLFCGNRMNKQDRQWECPAKER